ncbi:MAG: Phenylacetic acid catabolic protein [Actinomycetota bacterium]
MEMGDAATTLMGKPNRRYPPRTFDEGSNMPPDYREAVIRLIVETGELGSTEWHRQAMRRIAGWIELAPALADRVRMAEFYADEMRHGFIFENLLLSMGESLDRSDGSSIEGLNLLDELNSWEQVAVFMTLMDRAASFQFGDYRNSSYAPLASIAPSMTLDEQGHATTGLLHLKTVVKTAEGRRAAQQALERWWHVALDMFGTSTGRRQFRYIEWGLRDQTNDELRQVYLNHTRPLLEDLGLEVPDDLAHRRFV